jgi:hypothetical protein
MSTSEPAGIDWAIVGSQAAEGGVVILASRKVTGSTFTVDTGANKWTVSVTMTSYVTVMADSYPEAFAKLMQNWKPGHDPA